MKFKVFLCAIIALFYVGFVVAQDTTKVVLELPKTLDFSTITGFKQTVGLLISAVLTIISGYWSKGNEALKKYLPTTEKRVSFVGFILSVCVGLAFGFTGDTLTTLWTSLLGVFVGLGSYGAVKSSPKAEEAPQP